MSIRELNYLKISETKFAKTDFEQKSKKINKSVSSKDLYIKLYSI